MMDTIEIRFRFIPARAGNTSGSAGGGMLYTVHPRAGGEHYLG